MKDDLKKQIADSLKKGGFPTELKVGKVLNERDWFNISNYIYVDKTKAISREIDFYCVKHSNSNDFRYARFDAHLIVEVKKSEKPWAFFIQNIQKEFGDEKVDHRTFSSVSYRNINHLIWDRLYVGFPTDNCDFNSSSYAEVFRDSEPSNIYKAIDSVTKACFHFRTTNEIERQKKTPKDDNGFAGDLFEPIDLQRPSLVNVFIPLVVVDALLVKAELDNNSELSIEETSYVPFTSYYVSEFEVESSIIVNVVTLAFLPIFLKEVEDWIELRIQGLKEARQGKHFR
ncbi:hypothetical protein EXU57_24240 [Segetibacter sp. 3557_3]|uniref:hypothetical protein n=1 Tax=Segetibacter sp. 3557_3 TaxID=2547429 RepID=UPI0010588DA0|nr:hypothetical protein [Segetibacter sp. 3557_3]TDH18163.1 hypothetical protein EXU57_24240 [Segetibacter sp. 3557_3]